MVMSVAYAFEIDSEISNKHESCHGDDFHF